jgi:hypothetical protein
VVQEKLEAAKIYLSIKMSVPKNSRDKTYVISIYWVCGFPRADRKGC